MDSELIDILGHDDADGEADADYDVDIMESPIALHGPQSPEVYTPHAAAHATLSTSDRTTRSSSGVLRQRTLRPPPKLKLKLGEKSSAIASGTSFLGPYDRELDSDPEEDLVFEEQFLLRVPPGEGLEKLRKQVVTRGPMADISFKFRDSRRGTFTIGDTTFNSKLVDLPCIVEAQKTLDGKKIFKVADISQMLVLEPGGEESKAGFNVDEFIWPHGITPPLRHVRKRRFRKRINRRTIETVEQEVERLLEADAAADSVQYVVLENVNPDLSDSEFMSQAGDDAGFYDGDAPTPAHGTDDYDAPTPSFQEGDDGPGGADDEDAMDAELAAELDRAMDEASSGDDNDEDEESESEADDGDGAEDDEEEDEDEDDEFVQGRKRLNEEIRDLEAAVAKKSGELASALNPLIKKRFEDALKKMQADLEMKLAQRDAIAEERARRKARAAGEEVDDDEGEEENAEEGLQDDQELEGDIFGDGGVEDGMDMDLDPAMQQDALMYGAET